MSRRQLWRFDHSCSSWLPLKGWTSYAGNLPRIQRRPSTAVPAVARSFACLNQIKDPQDAHQDENWWRVRRIRVDLVVDVGGQLSGMLLGGPTV